jgi:hypothetical protein
MLHRRAVPSLAWSLGLTLCLSAPALAQDPVTKPTTTPAPGTGERLPQPRNLTAIQLSDGRIRVTWSRVPGATSYALVRSVPPDPQQPVTPNVTDTVYYDTKVTVGKTYYYLISGASETATGLRAGAPPVRATRSYDPSGSHVSPTNVVARYDSVNNRVNVTWTVPGYASRSIIYRSGVELGRDDTAPFSFSMPAPPPGTRTQFEVVAEDEYGNRSPRVASNELVISSTAGASTSGSGGGPTAPSGPTSTTGPTGTVGVTIGSAITMRVGASASAGVTLGGTSASRWVSLDEGIATVDGSGTVTARTAGRARVLAIAGGADGSVRVTLVQVTVSP